MYGALKSSSPGPTATLYACSHEWDSRCEIRAPAAIDSRDNQISKPDDTAMAVKKSDSGQREGWWHAIGLGDEEEKEKDEEAQAQEKKKEREGWKEETVSG